MTKSRIRQLPSISPCLRASTLLMILPCVVRADKVDDLVLATMKKWGTPGVSVAVVQKGKVIKLKGYGYANIEHRAKVTPNTVFELGSIGKMFTASLVMKLVEDGKVKLDESIRTYLPDAPAAWQSVTIRHMLTHTGGITRDLPENLDMRKDYTEEELLKMQSEIPLEFQPGEKWSYSNVGYDILGYMCSKVGGKFRGDLFSDRLFKPAGMSTARSISESEIVENRAAGYFINDGKFLNKPWTSPTFSVLGSAGIYVSLKDMVKWNVALDDDKVLSASIKTQMWTSVVLNDGTKPNYGFGWMVPVINGHKYMGHSGGMPGFKTSFRRFPDDQLAVIVLANSNTADPHRLSRKIAALYIPEVKIVPPPAVPDTAPTLTEALRKLLDGDDSIPVTKMTPAMQNIWSKQRVAEFSKEVQSYGARKLLVPIEMNKEGATYRVQYGKVVLLITLILDKNGLIQGMGREEED